MTACLQGLTRPVNINVLKKASSHFRINVNYSCMLIITGLRCRTHAVAMDSLPPKDTNGPVLRDGKLKYLNACWVHFKKDEMCTDNTAII